MKQKYKFEKNLNRTLSDLNELSKRTKIKKFREQSQSFKNKKERNTTS